MSEISMYEAQKKKMEGLCEEHDLTYRFQKDTYSFYLLIHDALDAFAEFFERFALLDEFEDRFQQRLGDVHVVHSPRSFQKAVRLCLTCLYYTIFVYLSIEKLNIFVDS